MNWVIYLRVSTQKQEARDLSIPAQKNICIKYAQDRGYTVVQEFSEHESATSVKGRDSFQEAIDFALDRKNDVKAFVVYDTSRFARNRVDAITYKRLLRNRGIDVFYATQTISNDPDGIFMEGIFELIDERYSKILGQVTLRGMRENAKKGFLNGSSPPYGYRFVRVTDERGNPKSKLEICENEAKIVRKIFALCTNGYGIRTLISELEELGYRARNGKKFKKGLIEHILHNEVYTGTLKFMDIRIENAHSAIIDKDTFLIIQDIMLGRKPKKGEVGYNASQYVFSGILRCAKCSQGLIVERVFKRARRYEYYVCSGQKNKKNSCTGVRHRIDFMDAFLKDKIFNKILSEENFPIIYDKIQSLLNKLRQDTPKSTVNLRKELAVVEKKMDNLVEAISEGAINRALVKEKLEGLEREKASLESKISKFTAQSFVDFPLSINTIGTVVNLIKAAIDNKKPLELKNFFKGFIRKIVTTSNSVSVEYNPLYMVMSNKPISSLRPLLAPRANTPKRAFMGRNEAQNRANC
jgi:site-specific DNA recombinase